MISEQSFWRPALAEAFGTLTLVFIGAGSVISLHRLNISNGGDQEAAMLVGVALAHGLAIAVMVAALGHICGGHFNPAVTIAALFTRRIKPELGLMYIIFQVLGGIAGSFLLVAAFPANWWDTPDVNLGTPALNGALDPAKGVLVEAVLTFFLVLVIFGTSIDGRNTNRAVASLAIGLTVTMDSLMGGYLTGAALNPARGFGPALLSSTWSMHYVWWLGPILGAIIAGLVYDSAYLEQPKAKAKPVEAAVEPPAPPAMVP